MLACQPIRRFLPYHHHCLSTSNPIEPKSFRNHAAWILVCGEIDQFDLSRHLSDAVTFSTQEARLSHPRNDHGEDILYLGGVQVKRIPNQDIYLSCNVTSFGSKISYDVRARLSQVKRFDCDNDVMTVRHMRHLKCFFTRF